MHWIDPEFLPEIEGTLERFMLNPKGEIDGLVVTDETHVHVAPKSCCSGFVASARAGPRWLRPHGSPTRAAARLSTMARKKKKDSASATVKPPAVEAAGTVRLSLYPPKSMLRGGLLADGMIVRVRTKQAQRFERLLRPQAALAVRGNGLETRFGRVIDAMEIGTDLASLTLVKGTDAKKKKLASPTERDRPTVPKTDSDPKWGSGQPERRLRMSKLIVASACHLAQRDVRKHTTST
jgi:hypothetical protein